MIQNEPMEVRSRGRLYTSARQRRRLDVAANDDVCLQVLVRTVDRSPDWGLYSQRAVFEASLRTYGVVAIPDDVQERLGVQEGDHVRVSMAQASGPDAEATRSVARPNA
jgi:hypothetical protein